MSTDSFSKGVIRKDCLSRREALTESEKEAFSIQICTWLVSYLNSVSNITNLEISAYLPIRSEVDLRSAFPGIIDLTSGLSLPTVIDRETIVFRRYVPGDPLVSAGFGTMGPRSDAPTIDPDLLIMPLAGFDASGTRLGYGAGHYDRALSRLTANGRSPHTVGVAFSVQQVDHIPAMSHDIPLQTVVTESGIQQTVPSFSI